MKQFLTTFLFPLLPVLGLQAQIDHLEPPFWWTGMTESSLQIMVHGAGIGETTVRLKGGKDKLTSVEEVENENYLFLNIDLGSEIEARSFELIFERANQLVESYEYKLHDRKAGAAEVEGFNSADVMYLVMPDRFANADPTNDQVNGMIDPVLDREDPLGRHGGDLQGITEHLDYIQEMGFTALWLNPALKNNQKHMSYHGYGITDFYKTDPRMGTNEDYLALADAASQKGIKLIMDMVFNHCGLGHWWMNDLPSQDWINQHPTFTKTNHKRTTLQDPYASESDYENMRDGWFVEAMPDLNQRNPLMATYLIQNSIWWIEYLGLAGIRMDTYPYPDKFMMADWCEAVLKEYPQFNIVGEEWSTNPVVVSYWLKGKENHDGYDGHLPSAMDFPLQHALERGLVEEESWGTGLIKLYEILANDVLYPNPNDLTIFGDNHDMPRIYMQLGKDVDLLKNAMVYLLTTRGIPQIYYGTEILMTHEEGDGHGWIRKDYPGGWDGDRVNAFTGEGLNDDAAAFQAYMKHLLHWRKAQPAIHSGKLTHFAPENDMYVFFRYNSESKIMVIINKSDSDRPLDLKRFKGQLKGYTQAKDITHQTTVSIEDTLELQARTPYIFELQ